jgi:hypothetical protein
MRLRSILPVLFSILALDAAAQDKGFVGLTLGAAIPLSDFASNSFSNNRAGFAKTG